MRKVSKRITWFVASMAMIAILVALWPKNSKLQNDFSIADESSIIKVDHQPWDALLEKYVHESEGEVSKFDYKSVSQEDKVQLAAYLSNLEQTRVSELNSVEQMAYWINLYNALTIQVVLDAYPVDSIKTIDSPFLKRGPWTKKRIQILTEPLSLDDIEHKILRPIYQDPRVHYGVNCASIGCPNLQAQAFTADNLEELLDLGAEQYINHPRGVNIIDGKLQISSLYKWFASDFGTQQDLFDHLIDYAEDSLAEKLEQLTQISDYHYDWAINDKS